VADEVASEPATTTPIRSDRSFALTLAAIAVTALVVRILVIVLVDPHVPRLGDASAYHLLANHLADGRGYIRPFDLLKFHLVVPTAEYPPLHPFLLSLAARAGLRSVEAQRIALAFVGGGTVALIGLLGRRIAGNAVGLVAAGLAALSPMMFLPEATLMSETVFVLLVTAALLLALRAYDAPTPLRGGALGLVLGLAVLTRAEAAVLGLLLLGGLLRPRDRRDAAPLVRRLALAALGVALMAAVVVPWTVRNQQTFHKFVPVSNNLGTALAGANCRLTYAGSSLGSWRSTFGAGDASAGLCFTGFNGSQPGFNEATAAADARHRGITYARNHVGDLPKVALARIGRTFGVYRPGQQIQLEALEGRPLGWERAGTWFEWALYPLAIAGAVILVRRRAPVWPLAAAVISVLASTLVTYGNQRFRIGAEPAILVAAATAVVAVVARARTGGTTDAHR
jgi:4-amino-4-deoxy-L-arabinose transferase-like glycosyltransferase